MRKHCIHTITSKATPEGVNEVNNQYNKWEDEQSNIEIENISTNMNNDIFTLTIHYVIYSGTYK